MTRFLRCTRTRNEKSVKCQSRIRNEKSLPFEEEETVLPQIPPFLLLILLNRQAEQRRMFEVSHVEHDQSTQWRENVSVVIRD